MRFKPTLGRLRMRPVILALSLVCLSSFAVLSLGVAAPPEPKFPFANSNEQRSEILVELHEIRTLLVEQNSLITQNASKDAPKR